MSERSERCEFLRSLVEKTEYERPDSTRHDVTRPHDAFDELISLQPEVRFTCGLLWWVATSIVPWIQMTQTLLDNDRRTWHVQSEGGREKCPWHNSGTA